MEGGKRGKVFRAISIPNEKREGRYPLKRQKALLSAEEKT
jgi:hypothetical protein